MFYKGVAGTEKMKGPSSLRGRRFEGSRCPWKQRPLSERVRLQPEREKNNGLWRESCLLLPLVRSVILHHTGFRQRTRLGAVNHSVTFFSVL